MYYADKVLLFSPKLCIWFLDSCWKTSNNPNVITVKVFSWRFPPLNSEAGSEIAFLAASWDCAVLSNDSDFFIFDIKGGYIPLSFLCWNSSRFTVKIYYCSKLASHFRIRSDLLPLFASSAGNDYVSANALGDFKSALGRVQTDKRVGKKGNEI